MSIDKFGRYFNKKVRGERGPPGPGFKLIESGDFDLELKRIRNVNEPSLPNDVATKSYVDKCFEILKEYTDLITSFHTQIFNDIILCKDKTTELLLNVKQIQEHLINKNNN